MKEPYITITNPDRLICTVSNGKILCEKDNIILGSKKVIKNIDDSIAVFDSLMVSGNIEQYFKENKIYITPSNSISCDLKTNNISPTKTEFQFFCYPGKKSKRIY